jgi:hypothetical protein
LLRQHKQDQVADVKLTEDKKNVEELMNKVANHLFSHMR